MRVKAHGLDVVTMGVCGARADDPAQRTLSLSDPDAGRHVEVVVSGERLVGATCIGAGQVASDLVAAYTRRTPVPSDPARLLLTALSAAPVVARRRPSPTTPRSAGATASPRTRSRRPTPAAPGPWTTSPRDPRHDRLRGVQGRGVRDRRLAREPHRRRGDLTVTDVGV